MFFNTEKFRFKNVGISKRRLSIWTMPEQKVPLFLYKCHGPASQVGEPFVQRGTRARLRYRAQGGTIGA